MVVACLIITASACACIEHCGAIDRLIVQFGVGAYIVYRNGQRRNVAYAYINNLENFFAFEMHDPTGQELNHLALKRGNGTLCICTGFRLPFTISPY